jgi:FeS assembly SUF system regulator
LRTAVFRLTRQADYAILLLAEMANGGGPVHAAPDLAHETGVPVPMVSKTLQVLAREGLLLSLRGPRGGYRLARPADQISIADIVIALDGPIAMTACSDGGEGDCGLEPRCRVHENWRKLNRVVIGALSRLSLAEMMQSEPPRLVMLEELARPAR